MGFEQDTLIYIEESDKAEASTSAKGFADNMTKNRAYINSLGAELALKYLTSENIDVSNIYNLHNIKKILEENDISDIMLPNIHIDVRVIFDENFIFIPKTHFTNGLVPDIYLAFNLAKDFTHVKFLGFFEPKLINKNNHNQDYYFIEKEKLSPVTDLKNYIINFSGNTAIELSENEMENSARIMMAMIDDDVNDSDKKILIQQLTKCASLRDKFIEFENFELLSYSASNDPLIIKQGNTLEAIPDISEFTEASGIIEIPAVEEPSNLEEINIDDIINPIEEVQEELTNDDAFNFDEIENETENINDDDNDFNFDKIETIDDTIVYNIDSDFGIDEQIFEINEIAEQPDNTDDSSIIGDIAALGTAAVIGTGIGTSAAMASEALAGLTTSAEIVKDAVDIVNNSLELANNITLENKEASNSDINIPDISNEFITDPISDDIQPISLDDIDTSSLIPTEDEEINAETISLDNVDTSNIHPDIDIDEDMIDNTISLDEMKDMAALNSKSKTISEEIEPEILSLDSVDTSNLIDTEYQEEQYTEEIISLDNVDTSNIHPDINIDEDLNDNRITLEEMGDIEAVEVDTEDLETVEAFEDLEEVETIEDIDNNVVEELNETADFSDIETENIVEELDMEIPPMDEINNVSADFSENMSLDHIDTENMNTEVDNDFKSERMSLDDFGNDDEEFKNNSEIDDFMDDTISLDDIGNVNNAETSPETFGKNLLEGLSTNGEDISIEGLSGIDLEFPQTDVPAEDISSNDLLAQIDDILNTTENSASEATEIPAAQVENNPDDEVISLNEFSTQGYIDAQSNAYGEEFIKNNDLSENQEKLGVLFDDNQDLDDDDDDDNNGLEGLQELEPQQLNNNMYNKTMAPEKGKKGVVVAAALIAVLATVSALSMLKPKNDENGIKPIESNTPSETEVVNNNVLSTNTPNIPIEDNSNMLTNTPDIDTSSKTLQPVKMSSTELKNTAIKKSKPSSSESYLTVQRLVWEVPDNLSYSNGIKTYLRTAGKSIKLSLSSDLLLATEYAYTNQIKVSLKLSSDGTVQDAKVVTGSGSDQIDKIVLQSVKDTLNVVKPPSGEVKQPNYNLSLIIYL